MAKLLIITGKNSSGKRTLVNHLAYSHGLTRLYEHAVDEESRDNYYAIHTHTLYRTVEVEELDQETNETIAVNVCDKEETNEFGFLKSDVDLSSNVVYVVSAKPCLINGIKAFFGEDNCKIAYLNMYNDFERIHRRIGEGNFDGLAAWTKDNDEAPQFEELEYDYKHDNKCLDNSKAMTMFGSVLREWGFIA